MSIASLPLAGLYRSSRGVVVIVGSGYGEAPLVVADIVVPSSAVWGGIEKSAADVTTVWAYAHSCWCYD